MENKKLTPQAPSHFESYEREPSQQMRAVLTILDAIPHLKKRVIPFIDLKYESIKWEPLMKIAWSSGERAALIWCYSIWTDEVKARSNPFDRALSMDSEMKKAVLMALAIRWGFNLK